VPDRYLCPVCGYGGLREPPWDNEAPSDEICPSCGIHLGYDDAAGGDAARREALHRAWREQWIAGGMKWWSPGQEAPADWNPEIQLASVTS
jgi:hypothetical protein